MESGIYITDQNELLVVFGGKIRVSSYIVTVDNSEPFKEMDFSELKTKKEIGSDLDWDPEGPAKEYESMHPVRLQFFDDRSIDVLIEQLQKLKSNK